MWKGKEKVQWELCCGGLFKGSTKEFELYQQKIKTHGESFRRGE